MGVICVPHGNLISIPSRSRNARDAFGNLRLDETDADVPSSDHFSVVLEAIDYDTNYANDGETLGGAYGAVGSGGRVVSGTLEFLEEGGVFMVEYVPFVAGTHLLNVTFQVQKQNNEIAHDVHEVDTRKVIFFRWKEGRCLGVTCP